MSLIIVFLFILIVLISLGKNRCSQWGPEAKKEYNKMVKRFGKHTYLNSTKGGVAVWKNFHESVPLVCVMVVDETECTKEENGIYNSMYITINYYADKRRINEVMRITSSIYYNADKKELTAESGSFEGCMAILVLADRICKGLISTQEAENNDLFGSYVFNAEKNSADNYRILQAINDNYKLKLNDRF